MKKLIVTFKKEVQKASTDPRFVHHEWFVKYHLEIVEKIALELCKLHKSADKNLVLLLVWLHDYGKIVDFNNQYEATLAVGRQKLLAIGFPSNFIEKIISYTDIIDKKTNLAHAPIEVQIVSSADGASHLIGPFYIIHWKEHSQDTCEELMKENKRKALDDWNKKIVLPEVKKAFLSRYKQLLEYCGEFPEKYFS